MEVPASPRPAAPSPDGGGERLPGRGLGREGAARLLLPLLPGRQLVRSTRDTWGRGLLRKEGFPGDVWGLRAGAQKSGQGRSPWAPWGKVSFSCRQARGDHKFQLGSDDAEGNQNAFWGGTLGQALTVSAPDA